MHSHLIRLTRDHLTWKFILIKNLCLQHLHVLYSHLIKLKINHLVKYLNCHLRCVAVFFYSCLRTTMVIKWHKRASLSTPSTNGTTQICTDNWSISTSTKPRTKVIPLSMESSIKDLESILRAVKGLIWD